MLSIEKQVLYLLSKVSFVQTSELINIYTHRNYNDQYIRNVLSRLKKDEYIDSPCRSKYAISTKGLSYIKYMNLKPTYRDLDWDGKWSMVMFDLPETERKKKDRVKSLLLQMGYGVLYKNLYISPWNHIKQVQDVSQENSISNLRIAQADFVYNPLTLNQVEEIWKLVDLKNFYETKMSWFIKEFKPYAEKAIKDNNDPVEIFSLFLQLGEVINELYFRDPMLPKDLLPDYWNFYKHFNELYAFNLHLLSNIPRDSKIAKFIQS